MYPSVPTSVPVPVIEVEVLADAGDAEVGDLDPALTVRKMSSALDVAVDDLHGAGVGQGVADLGGDADSQVERAAPGA